MILRVWVPPPQVLVQALQSSQEYLQSTGQSSSVQFKVWVSVLLHFPPYFSSRSLSRVRVITPFAHETLQLLHSVQSPQVQFCGHGLSVLQSLCCSFSSHFFPPHEAFGFGTLVRCVVPFPQPLTSLQLHSPLQGDHSPQVLNLQSTGQH